MRLVARSLAVLVAAMAGVAAGVLGSFVHRMSLRVVGVQLPLGLLVALAGLAGLLLLTGTVLRSRLPLLGPALGWVLGVFPLAVPRPEGDLVVGGTLSGYVFLLGGALLIGMCLTLPFDSAIPRHPAASGSLHGLSGSVPRSVA